MPTQLNTLTCATCLSKSLFGSEVVELVGVEDLKEAAPKTKAALVTAHSVVATIGVS
jgi:hypothetical protein